MNRQEMLNRCEQEIRSLVACAKRFRARSLSDDNAEVSYRISEYFRNEAMGTVRGMRLCGAITHEQEKTLQSAINEAVYCD